MRDIREFVHLRNHTAYSRFRSTSRIADSLKVVKEQGMTSLAITDAGVLHGVAEFCREAKRLDIKPIIGCEISLDAGQEMQKEMSVATSRIHQLVLLAENEAGYKNLLKLVAGSKMNRLAGRLCVSKEELRVHRGGLIGLSAGMHGEMAWYLAHRDVDGAIEAAREYADIFGRESFFVELTDHGLEEERATNQLLAEVAGQVGLGLVATNNNLYAKQEHALAHHVLCCLGMEEFALKQNEMGLPCDAEHYIKGAEEMWALFESCPEALMNTVAIAERCNLELSVNGEEKHFPVFEISAEYKDAEDYLSLLGRNGMKKRYGVNDVNAPKDEVEQAITSRYFYEMDAICKAGYADYFLIVQDYVNSAKNKDIAVSPGRGAGSASMMAYLLGITGVDPLLHGLVFERFMNPKAGVVPDIDIEFCPARRSEVVDYIKRKYGAEHTASIVTFRTFCLKQWIGKVARVLGASDALYSKLVDDISDDPALRMAQVLETNEALRQLVNRDDDAGRIIQCVKVLEGLPCHVGVHAAGIVVGDKPLVEVLPVGQDGEGRYLAQFDAKNAESVGVIKLDFLGLSALSVIQDAENRIAAIGGVLDYKTSVMDDEKTYEMLKRGDTDGVFWLEYEWMRQLLRDMQPNCFQDLTVLMIYRPNAVGVLFEYTKRKHGKALIEYDHPLLENVIKDTYGVIIYQEQVVCAIHALAGISLAEAEVLRRVIGKANPETIAEQRIKFVNGCMAANQIQKEEAGDIFDRMKKNAGYTFNKAHAVAHGMISYQTAYLKARYPKEFMAAVKAKTYAKDSMPLFSR
jgi:DNA polymerase-3 subunit alpha